MTVSKNDLIEALDILTKVQKKFGGRRLILLGGSALMVLKGRRMTIDVDTYIADIDFITQHKRIETLFRKLCRERGCKTSAVGIAQPGTLFFDLTLPTKNTFKVEVLSTIDKVVDVDKIISDLGAFHHSTLNGIEIMCPTYESMFVMKLLSYDYHRKRDLYDLKWLIKHINRDKVVSFCIDNEILYKYEKVFGKAANSENSYPLLYKLALELSDRTLRTALKRLHYPVPPSHREKASLYARHYASVKSANELQEFMNYLKYKKG